MKVVITGCRREHSIKSSPKAFLPAIQLPMRPVKSVLDYTTTDHERPIWAENPRFSHQMLTEAPAEALKASGAKSNIDIQSQLLAAVTSAQISHIINEHFITKIRSILQLGDDGAIQDSWILDQPANSLGIDSLVAIDLRTWFLKNLSVKMPVLKIPSGSRVSELVDYAIENLPSRLLSKTEDEQRSISKHSTAINVDKDMSTISSNTNTEQDNKGGSVNSDNSPPASATSDTTIPSASDSESLEEECHKSIEAKPSISRIEPLSHSQSMF